MLEEFIKVGQALTPLVMVVGFVHAVGRFTEQVKAQMAELKTLREDFNRHAAEDRENFADLHEAVLKVAMRGD